MVNSKERFLRVLTGKKVDRVPFIKVFGAANAIVPQWEMEQPGISMSIDKSLEFEGAGRGWEDTGVNVRLSNLDSVTIIEENESKIIKQEGDGSITETQKGKDFKWRYLKWAVKNRQDWEKVKNKHMQADDPNRFPKNWNDKVEEYKRRDYPLTLSHGGVYGFARTIMGDINLAYGFYDDPELIHDIMFYYTTMVLQIWEKMLEYVDFDLIECWEDMASNKGSFISPEVFNTFLRPHYLRIREFANKHGIELVMVDCDGNIHELTKLMLASGVNAIYPFEVQAGNDVEKVLDTCEFIGIIGGLDKNSMAVGKREIDKEILKAERLIKKGRFIPGPDHFVLSDVSLKNYIYFMQELRKVILNTPCGNQ
jgi:uroporphyrinogen-III decarboxylase